MPFFSKNMIQNHVVLVLMKTWIQKVLEADPGLEEGVRDTWWITLRWYLKYCEKQELGDPTSRDNGKVFWKEAVRHRNESFKAALANPGRASSLYRKSHPALRNASKETLARKSKDRPYPETMISQKLKRGR